MVWAIQEHNLFGAQTRRKQALGNRLVFYGRVQTGFSGTMTVVHRELKPIVVANHPWASGRGPFGKVKDSGC